MEFTQYCFSIVEGNPELAAGSSNTAVVGFEQLTRDPTSGPLALDVEMGAEPVRIPLRG